MPSIRREVSVAGWLAAEGYPAARLVTGAEQPIVVDGHPVTFWEGLADGDTYASTGEMGTLLRRLHELEPPPFSLPPLRPFDKVTQRLKRAVISDTTRAYLSSMADQLAAEYGRLRFVLPAGHLHGDFNIGNVLRDTAGRPKIIDLDGFVTGPREWDLMQTAMYYDSFRLAHRGRVRRFRRWLRLRRPGVVGVRRPAGHSRTPHGHVAFAERRREPARR
ncbi:phosphotransferase enzyme family protein [Streptomyces sp. GESEQ-35]|uniref:phosphotransferase enzyme family protein n=1 Tax=Streptomyces sp. GESEQ-35 TaxID=2812657 RepID=UPI001FF60636|nr:aminoglycoside phosphotransferase family protein [Streptomyces sp. GESEQ-35]